MVDRVPAKKVERVQAKPKDAPTPIPKKRAPGVQPGGPEDNHGGYGQAFEVFRISDNHPFRLSFRKKRLSDAWVRRYFAGAFQIAYVREDESGLLHIFNVGPDYPKEGRPFNKEADLHDYLRRMLME